MSPLWYHFLSPLQHRASPSLLPFPSHLLPLLFIPPPPISFPLSSTPSIFRHRSSFGILSAPIPSSLSGIGPLRLPVPPLPSVSFDQTEPNGEPSVRPNGGPSFGLAYQAKQNGFCSAKQGVRARKRKETEVAPKRKILKKGKKMRREGEETMMTPERKGAREGGGDRMVSEKKGREENRAEGVKSVENYSMVYFNIQKFSSKLYPKVFLQELSLL